MSRPRKTYKTIQPRKLRGSAVVDVYDQGHRHTITLGPWDSPQADEEFERIRARLRAGTTPLPRPGANVDVPSDMTVAEALLRYDEYIERYYKNADGMPTGTADDIRITLVYIRKGFAALPLAEFNLTCFRQIRAAMIADGRVRNQVNRRASMVRAFVRFCIAEDMPVAAGLLEKLKAVKSLSPGRDGAKEGTPRAPADPAAVEKILPVLPPAVKAIVGLMRLTGARPSEITNARPREIDRTVNPWELQPEQHKGRYRGKARCIYIGPVGQAILEPWLTGADPDQFVFSPRRSEEMRNAQRSESRVTPKYPSHMRRNATKRKGRVLDTKFKRGALTIAIKRACKAVGVKRFSAYQLRHLVAVELREKYGLEHVRAVLGHSFASMADHYSKAADKALASTVANERG